MARIEPGGGASDWDRRAFCDHFPGAFAEKEAEVGHIVTAMDEMTHLLAGVSARLRDAHGPPPAEEPVLPVGLVQPSVPEGGSTAPREAREPRRGGASPLAPTTRK